MDIEGRLFLSIKHWASGKVRTAVSTTNALVVVRCADRLPCRADIAEAMIEV